MIRFDIWSNVVCVWHERANDSNEIELLPVKRLVGLHFSHWFATKSIFDIFFIRRAIYVCFVCIYKNSLNICGWFVVVVVVIVVLFCTKRKIGVNDWSQSKARVNEQVIDHKMPCNNSLAMRTSLLMKSCSMQNNRNMEWFVWAPMPILSTTIERTKTKKETATKNTRVMNK